jgi:iron complex transport system permease protein
VLTVGLIVTVLLAVTHGAYAISTRDVFAILGSKLGAEWGPFLPQQDTVLMSIRLPRVGLGILAGAGLAVAGAALQGLFRNPLADPGLIGVSSGAALAVASVIVLGATRLRGFTALLGGAALPIAGFCGGMLTTLLIYQCARVDGRTSLGTMLLAGIAINAMAMAGIGVYSMIATDEQLRSLTFWTFGSLGGGQWRTLGIVAPPVLAGILAVNRLAPALNALLLGEREAQHLGFTVQGVKWQIIIVTALLTGTLVAVCGVIGFVALVAPHMVRMVCGPDHRLLIPAAALTGAILVLTCDLLGRTLVAPAELSIGIVTAAIGSPFFLALLVRQRRQVGL